MRYFVLLAVCMAFSAISPADLEQRFLLEPGEGAGIRLGVAALSSGFLWLWLLDEDPHAEP